MNPYELIPECRYGRFLVPRGDRYMASALRAYGEYSQQELEILLMLLNHAGGKRARVITVGANIGSLVVPLAQHAGEVVAFEPVRCLHQLLAANVALNGLTNVRTYWAALGSAGQGTVHVPRLRMDMQDNYGGISLKTTPPEGATLEPVQVMALDDVPQNDCTFLTLDVEGMEWSVLLGGIELIRRCRPFIWFEAEDAQQNEDILTLLEPEGYTLFWMQTPHYNPGNWRTNSHDIYADDHGVLVTTNALACPRAMLPLFEGQGLERMVKGQAGKLIPPQPHPQEA